MHYRQSETRGCYHGPSDGNPAHGTLVGTEFGSTGAPRTPDGGLKRTTSSSLTTRSTAGTCAAAGRVKRNASPIRSPPRQARTVAAPRVGAKKAWTALLFIRRTTLAEGPLLTPSQCA